MLNLAVADTKGTVSPNWASLWNVYDLVGVDMRGTGNSHAVDCDASLFLDVQWPFIKDQKTYDETVAAASAWGQSCANKTGPLIHHLGTDQAARDFELVRQALGHDKFNYMGFSYGTEVGSQYADIFPDNVGRMFLDGSTNRYLHEEDRILTSTAGVDGAIRHFFRWCNETTDCALHGTDQAAIFTSVMDTAAKGELRSTGCYQGKCGDGSVIPDWLFALRFELMLHDGLRSVPDSTANYRDTAKILNYTYVEKSGLAFQDRSQSDGLPSELAITCADRPERVLSAADYRNIFTVAPVVAPLSRGGGLQSHFSIVCTGWPIKSSNPPRTFDPERQKRLPPIMIVDTLYDPATVPACGLGMRALMPTAFTIYRDGGGHTAFSNEGEAAAAMVAFLINGTRPEDGTVYRT